MSPSDENIAPPTYWMPVHEEDVEPYCDLSCLTKTPAIKMVALHKGAWMVDKPHLHKVCSTKIHQQSLFVTWVRRKKGTWEWYNLKGNNDWFESKKQGWDPKVGDNKCKKHNGPNSVMVTPYVAFPVSWLIKSLLYQWNRHCLMPNHLKKKPHFSFIIVMTLWSYNKLMNWN
jgi:hypothetical protein